MYVYVERPRLEQPFRDMLTGKLDRRILALTGEGGMGKSRLLEKFQVISMEAGVYTPEILDFRYTENRSVSRIIEIISQLDKARFSAYFDIRREFEKIRLMRETPEPTYRDIEDKMDKEFVRCLDSLLADKKVLVFLDTFEAVRGTHIDDWLQSSLLPRLSNRDRLHLVVAGRTPTRFQGQEEQTQQMSVPPFSLEETRQYARAVGMPVESAEFEEALQVIFTATGGHPVLVAWAFDYVGILLTSRDVEQIASESQGGTKLFCQRLAEQTVLAERIDLIQVACLNRRFDAEIFAYVAGWSVEECSRRIEEWLAGFSSILRQGPYPQSCELHDVVADVINRYAWPAIDPSGQEWQRLREQAIAYYEQQIPDPEVVPWKRHAYMAERMFYLFDRCTHVEPPLDCLKGVLFDIFRPEFNVAINAYQIGLARSLVGEASKFEQYFDEELRNWYDVLRERLLTREGKLEEALDLCHDLLNRPGADDELKGQVWSGIGRARLLLGEYDNAISAYEKAVELRDKAGLRAKVADELSYLGTAYHVKGEWEQAKDHFLRSFRVALEVGGPEGLNRAASAANQAAQVALLMGDAATTRSLGRQALRIWEELGDFFGQASALTTLGRMAEFSAEYREAEARFKEALDLYTAGPVPSAFGEAHVNTYLSRVHRRQGRLAEAEGLLRETIRIFRELNRQQLAFALAELGCVLRDQEKWSEAERYFEEAAALAEEIKDWYRLTVIYEDLCVLGRRRGDSPGQVEENLSKVEELAEQWGYQLFLGRVEAHRGDLAFGAEDYPAAFDHYVRACHHLAQYHTDFYIRFLSHVEDQLYKRSYEEIPAYCDRMMAYWQQHDLAEKHTALMERFTRAKQMAQSFAE